MHCLTEYLLAEDRKFEIYDQQKESVMFKIFTNHDKSMYKLCDKANSRLYSNYTKIFRGGEEREFFIRWKIIAVINIFKPAGLIIESEEIVWRWWELYTRLYLDFIYEA